MQSISQRQKLTDTDMSQIIKLADEDIKKNC